MSALNEPISLPTRVHPSNEELANTMSHGVGLIAGLIGAPMLLLAARHNGSDGFFVGTIVFCVTMLALYLTSTLYHAWPLTGAKDVLQVLDHSAIFCLIAGTYTPLTLGPLRGFWGLTILGIVWAMAIFGIILKVTRGTSRHHNLAMFLYLGTGWSGLIFIQPLILKLPPGALFWLVAGGVVYTAGVLFFVNERLRYSHLVWHLFVLAGTGCHFLALLACTA
jgi:hemolysin III